MKRRRIILAVLLIAAFGIFADWMLRPREPVYEGKRLSVWLEEYSLSNINPPSDSITLRVPAQTAIRQIGTNAIPTLLKLLRARDSALKTKIIALIERQSVIRWHFHTASQDHWIAEVGFEVLGPIGKPSVPALTDLLNDSNPEVQQLAAGSLGSIGPDARAAIPALIQHLNDQERVKYAVVWALGAMKTEPKLVVPALIQHLDVTNANYSGNGFVIRSLGEYGNQAEAAVPVIESMLTATNKYVLMKATNVLKQIDSEAATKAGVE